MKNTHTRTRQLNADKHHFKIFLRLYANNYYSFHCVLVIKVSHKQEINQLTYPFTMYHVYFRCKQYLQILTSCLRMSSFQVTVSTTLLARLMFCCLSMYLFSCLRWLYYPKQHDIYLIHKHTSLHWCALLRKNIEVCSGGKTRLHHGHQRVLRNPCELLEKERNMISTFKIVVLHKTKLQCLCVYD